jgi:hypothetical protein
MSERCVALSIILLTALTLSFCLNSNPSFLDVIKPRAPSNNIKEISIQIIDLFLAPALIGFSTNLKLSHANRIEMKTAPRTGTNAQEPGKLDFLLISKNPINNKPQPKKEKILETRILCLSKKLEILLK